MNIADHIYEHVKLMPDTVAREVLNFIEFLEVKQKPAASPGQNHDANHVSLRDANEDHSLLETLHLMQSPANAKWLQKGIEQHRRGEAQEIDVTPYLD
jgi:PHD/YefM family antitoxin component YafN of YafNO toxin-antitoxin module